MIKTKIVYVIFILTFLAGCVTMGVKFDPQKTYLIKQGETTKEESIQLFGKPFSQGKGFLEGKEVEVFLWEYAETGSSSSGINSQALEIFFSENKVLSYMWVSNFPKP